MSYMYEQQLAHAANSRCMYVDLRLIALTSQLSRLIWLISEPQAKPARATSVKSSAAWPGCQLKASSKGQWMTYDHMDDKHLRWQTSDFTACLTQNWADGKTIAQALYSSSSGNVCEGRPTLHALVIPESQAGSNHKSFERLRLPQCNNWKQVIANRADMCHVLPWRRWAWLLLSIPSPSTGHGSSKSYWGRGICVVASFSSP